MHTDVPAHTSNTQNKVNQGFENNIEMFETEPQTQHNENAHLLTQNAQLCSKYTNKECAQPNCLTSAKRRALCACFILKRLIFC